MTDALTQRVLARGRELGFDTIGIAGAEVFVEARAELLRRKAAGLHDGMGFTYINPQRSTDPRRTVEEARSLIVVAINYRRRDVSAPPGLAVGRVARYAWSDIYGSMRAGLVTLARELRAEGYRSIAAADDNALVDRSAAYRAGLGWFAKNANLLLPGLGSWYVLGSVITTAPLVAAEQPVADACGSCTRCLPGCPTGAIIEPGVLDASKCLAWLLQRTGSFPEEYRVALGNRIYGCDECQEVCPPNRTADRHHPPPPAEDDAQPWVDMVALLLATDHEILQRYGRWYIPERNPVWVRRNALVVLGNTARSDDDSAREVLERYASGADPLLAEHALWALAQLAGRA